MPLVDNLKEFLDEHARLAEATQNRAREIALGLGHTPTEFKVSRGGWRVSECIECHLEMTVTGRTARGAMLDQDCATAKDARRERERKKVHR
jgi:hypothetical protein